MITISDVRAETKIVSFHGRDIAVPQWTYCVTYSAADKNGRCDIIAWGAEPTWDSEYSCYSYKHCDQQVVGTCVAQPWTSKDSLVKVG